MLPRIGNHVLASRCSSIRTTALGMECLISHHQNQQQQQQQQQRCFAKMNRRGGKGAAAAPRNNRLSARERAQKAALEEKDKLRRRREARANKTEKILRRHNDGKVSETKVPPLMLAPTASPFVYLARSTAFELLGIENEEESFGGKPPENCTSLMQGISRGPPRSFKSSTFRHYPPHTMKKTQDEIPEVAFLGRSNVGKSSLANAIMGDDKLCMTSKSPGRTQKEYYYGMVPKDSLEAKKSNLNSIIRPLGWIVDLPGYGYAKAPGSIVEGWQASTQRWLEERRDAGTLQRLYLLIDARRGPMKVDRTIMRWMDDAQIPYTVVLTKVDRVQLLEIIKIVNELCLRYESISVLGVQNEEEFRNSDDEEGYHPPGQSSAIHLTSSKENMGLYELMHSIESDFAAVDDDDE